MLTYIIEAIKIFDIKLLEQLLDNDKSYMDVTKKQFLDKLESCFLDLKKSNCHKFDDTFFGICNSCNRGCSAITFLAAGGFYLDLFLETDGSNVTDIYVCHNVENFTSLNKVWSVNFDFYEDEKINFKPSPKYIFIKSQCEMLLADVSTLNNVHIERIIDIYLTYGKLRFSVGQTSVFDGDNILYYITARDIVDDMNVIDNIARDSDWAVNALIDYHLAEDERSMVKWIFENYKYLWRGVDFDIKLDDPQNTLYKFKILDHVIAVDIEGYAHVFEFYKKLDVKYFEILCKYEVPMEKRRGRQYSYNLETHLRYHEQYIDLVDDFEEENQLR